MRLLKNGECPSFPWRPFGDKFLLPHPELMPYERSLVTYGQPENGLEKLSFLRLTSDMKEDPLYR